MPRALICDLDNTLFPAHTIPASVLDPLHEAVLAANTGPSAIPSDVLERALAAARRLPFDVVAEEFHLPVTLRTAWMTAQTSLQVTVPLTPYDDVAALARLALPRFLVTTGFRRLQESKIAALGIGHLFDAVYVDAIDSERREGKAGVFRRIVAEYALTPAHVLVVGDSAESELRAGRDLGMVTVQVLRDTVEPCLWADHRIHTLYELASLVSAETIVPH